MNLADGSDYAGAHHRTSLTHHWVSGVGVSQTELEPAAFHLLGQAYGRCQVSGERLVADNMESSV